MTRRHQDPLAGFGRPEHPRPDLLPTVVAVGALVAAVLLVGGPVLLALPRLFGA